MSEIESIRRVIALYGQLLDSKRFEEWGELFTQDAVFRVWGQTYRGRQEIVREIAGMQPDSPGKHVVLQPVIDLDDASHARCWTDLCALSTTAEPTTAEPTTAEPTTAESATAEPASLGGISIATIGRYHDTLTRDPADGRWRIRQRVLVMAGEDVPDDVDPTPPF